MRRDPVKLMRWAAERGHADHGWLDTWHSFSFADYLDPRWMGFRALRVINDDRIAAGRGFGMHPHRDMEIITWVLEGRLRHQDSLGHQADILPGEAQRMSAGRGIFHSEANPSPTEDLRLLQIWLLPSARGLEPSYEQRSLPLDPSGWRLLASPEGDGAVTLHSAARVWVADPPAGQVLALKVTAGRHLWIQLATGCLRCQGETLRQGDAMALSQVEVLELEGVEENTQALVFDLA